jgi:hypothetical protein
VKVRFRTLAGWLLSVAVKVVLMIMYEASGCDWMVAKKSF